MNQALETAVTRFLALRARFGAGEVVVWLAALSTVWLLPTWHLILTDVVIWGLLALSLDLVLGFAGLLSLGHAAFFGTGAFVAGLLAKHEVITEPTIALVVAGLTAAALGFATSFLVLRGSDLTRLMVTLGVAMVCFELANRFGDITGGADGLQGIPTAVLFGGWQLELFGYSVGPWRFGLFGQTAAYVYALAVLFLLYLLARRIVSSPFGLSLKAIKGNPLRCAAVGIAVNWRLVAVYALSAGYAGIAGALRAQTQAFASLTMLWIDQSADALLILIIGGTGYLYGGLAGALIYRLLQDYLSNLDQRFWQFWIGLLLVMMVLFGRIYGGLLTALIIAVPIWLDVPLPWRMVGTVAVVLALGLVRVRLLAGIRWLEQQAVGLVRRIWPLPKPIAPGTKGHA